MKLGCSLRAVDGLFQHHRVGLFRSRYTSFELLCMALECTVAISEVKKQISILTLGSDKNFKIADDR